MNAEWAAVVLGGAGVLCLAGWMRCRWLLRRHYRVGGAELRRLVREDRDLMRKLRNDTKFRGEVRELKAMFRAPAAGQDRSVRRG